MLLILVLFVGLDLVLPCQDFPRRQCQQPNFQLLLCLLALPKTNLGSHFIFVAGDRFPYFSVTKITLTAARMDNLPVEVRIY